MITRDQYIQRLVGKRELKAAMVDVKHMLIRPNRVQPTDDVQEMNRRSQALAKLLTLKENHSSEKTDVVVTHYVDRESRPTRLE